MDSFASEANQEKQEGSSDLVDDDGGSEVAATPNDLFVHDYRFRGCICVTDGGCTSQNAFISSSSDFADGSKLLSSEKSLHMKESIGLS